MMSDEKPLTDGHRDPVVRMSDEDINRLYGQHAVYKGTVKDFINKEVKPPDVDEKPMTEDHEVCDGLFECYWCQVNPHILSLVNVFEGVGMAMRSKGARDKIDAAGLTQTLFDAYEKAKRIAIFLDIRNV